MATDYLSCAYAANSYFKPGILHYIIAGLQFRTYVILLHFICPRLKLDR